MKNCISLLNYLISTEPDPECYENLAAIYELVNDYARASDAWSHSDSPKACYRRGVLYMYKTPLQQDLDLAEELLNKAALKGHPYAKEKLDKVREFKKRDKERVRRLSNRTYSKRVEYSPVTSSSSSSCFITTAVCLSLGKTDTCEELMLLRHYRDALSACDDRLAVLVKEYYRIAPTIVNKINSEKDAEKIYIELWDKYILPICKIIKNGDPKRGSKIYIEMVCMLSKKYNVQLSDQAYQVANSLIQEME